ncbi:MAG: hypothetical protein CVT90_02075, partial [Candidatus Altiarchaeales archaeon HGW-Altiarchaeales-3]
YISNKKLEINNKMKNEQIPYRGIIIGISFVIFGAICLLFFPKPDRLLYATSSLIIVVGIVMILRSLHEIFRYKKTGEIKIRIDERAELNHLKASRIGFLVFASLTTVILIVWSFELINEIHALYLFEVTFAAGLGLYAISYYLYERNEKIKVITNRNDEVYCALEHFGENSYGENFSIKYSDLKNYLDDHYWRYDSINKLKSVLNELSKGGKIEFKEQDESTLLVKIIEY